MLKIYTIVNLVVTFLLAILCICFVENMEFLNKNAKNEDKEPDGGFRFD